MVTIMPAHKSKAELRADAREAQQEQLELFPKPWHQNGKFFWFTRRGEPTKNAMKVYSGRYKGGVSSDVLGKDYNCRRSTINYVLAKVRAWLLRERGSSKPI